MCNQVYLVGVDHGSCSVFVYMIKRSVLDRRSPVKL